METHSQQQVRVLCSRVPEHAGHPVTVSGWVRSIRHLGRLAFVQVRDRSGVVQCVLEGELAAALPNPESVVTVTGTASLSPKAPGGVEIHARELRCISAAAPLPFEINKETIAARLDTVLDHRVIALRHPRLHATFRIQSALAGAFREGLRRREFTQIFTPKIVASGTEGGSNLFPVDYFGRQAYLAQSPQFYKQMMVGAGYERVFEIAPVYRAEEHNTSRHLNEYVSLDVEMSFIRSEEELMDLEQELLGSMLEKVAAECESELALLGVDLALPSDIPRIPIAEAQRILERTYGKTSPKGDLDPEGERLLCQHVAEKGKPSFVFVTRYPRDIRPMYAKPAPEDSALTASFDLLCNGLEITTGGQRIHDYDELVASIRGRGMNPDHFTGYLDVFRYGMPPHGGFAIGLERLTSRLLGQSNVREASAFPRDRMRLTP
ncbi:aspartate--tRNA(Asn) ligase [Paenibacillus ginsengarvi]|uniref:Aspartate--tRNA(Asp/Asn) ligase n=1 Tax=Paenibacillus ginsengarvi TaxID=400777 RepID=A0A3B0CLH8_9BACL|nr:aspartate--tRNA(Asn) ligase [Paenibacillus ginsengarvi]RKN85598.1 aspartate--tRNA(Asn) ligase [Paenibacillus ginsengarvi]